MSRLSGPSARGRSFEAVVGHVRLVGLAGTVATLAQMDAELLVYDREVVHHRTLSLATVDRWRDLLASETPEVRLGHPGMVKGREDVLAGGALHPRRRDAPIGRGSTIKFRK